MGVTRVHTAVHGTQTAVSAIDSCWTVDGRGAWGRAGGSGGGRGTDDADAAECFSTSRNAFVHYAVRTSLVYVYVLRLRVYVRTCTRVVRVHAHLPDEKGLRGWRSCPPSLCKIYAGPE